MKSKKWANETEFHLPRVVEPEGFEPSSKGLLLSKPAILSFKAAFSLPISDSQSVSRSAIIFFKALIYKDFLGLSASLYGSHPGYTSHVFAGNASWLFLT
ncbi:hypothetical protein FW774_06080 [Pedobacter sp. BS3]|uniref:hypothetical protein n=1 Tax=Pedobacter sp. BS3 TaxID=2567937 RepID=UPI0011ECF724|nr:hypothetical protein [Pedobacter sp. BS3]TZF84553.1 hypothetical protein FW774_06080 [Pedobacter sp. BS3]